LLFGVQAFSLLLALVSNMSLFSMLNGLKSGGRPVIICYRKVADNIIPVLHWRINVEKPLSD